MIRERFIPLPGFEDQYEISNHGNIKSLSQKCYGRIMKLEIDRSGYYVIKLRKFGVCSKKAIHRMVYESFKGTIGINEVIHHIDENKLNNIESNLLKVTKPEHRKLHNIGVKPVTVFI